MENTNRGMHGDSPPMLSPLGLSNRKPLPLDMGYITIIKNAVRCLTCGDTIESKHRHDFVTCSCGRISVDGGHDYLKRSFVPGCKYEDVGEYEEIEGIKEA